jgi:NAD+ kinase
MSTQLSRRKVLSGNLSFNRLGIVAKADSKTSVDCIQKLMPLLKKFKGEKANSEIFIDESLRGALVKNSFLTPQDASKLGETCDLLLSIGGDGTLLRTARLLLESEGWKRACLLGINTGRLGFLTLLGIEAAAAELAKILREPQKSETEDRACLEVKIARKKKIVGHHHVLNDCVLKSGALSRLIEFGVSMNGEFLSLYRADGLIISTPTGSTAYNLAAGGAILEPQIPAIQLTPICAQSFSNKPIVVSDDNLIELTVQSQNSDAHLTLDGHTGIALQPEDQIAIRRSPKKVALLLPSGKGRSHYIQSLRQKLKWGLVSPHSS